MGFLNCSEGRMVTVPLVSKVLPEAEGKDEQCWEATLNTFRETRNGEWP